MRGRRERSVPVVRGRGGGGEKHSILCGVPCVAALDPTTVKAAQTSEDIRRPYLGRVGSQRALPLKITGSPSMRKNAKLPARYNQVRLQRALAASLTHQ